MKKFKTIIISILSLLLVIIVTGCSNNTANSGEGGGGQSQGGGGQQEPPVTETVDYVAETKLTQTVTEDSDFFGEEGIAYATVERCVDGDTAIFLTGGVSFTARFLGVDTPESTGGVEKWGKTASLFTASKLNNAVKIVVQTNGGAAKTDTTGNRYLTYVWYQPTTGADFRLINLELVQEGLSYGKSETASRYASVLTQAQVQAIRLKLRMFGNDIDENFYYGDAQVTTIKGILENFTELEEKRVKVKFDCVVAKTNGLYVYVQDYDEETGEIYSILLYKGYNLNTSKLKEGYNVCVCGTVQKYNDLAQISGMVDIKGNADSLKVYSINNEVEVTPITPAELNGQIKDSLTRRLVSLNDIEVTSIYTTKEGSSAGAMTITGSVNGQTVTIRTGVFNVDEDYFKNKTINVVGIVEVYNNKYQIDVLSLNDIEVL